MTIKIWIIIALALLILATLGFYLTIYYRFTSFINEDKDRINTFSECCFNNLYEETFSNEEEKSMNDKPDVTNNSLEERNNDVIDKSIDNF